MNLSDISIINLLPPNLAKDKNVRMMCEAFDIELRRMIVDIPGINIIPNLVLKKIIDNLLLDCLAWQFHCDFYSTDFSIEQKQEIILKSLDWHTRKGTPSVVEEIVSTVFSKAVVQEWFEYGGLPYRFKISTEEEIPYGEERANFIRAINSVKNTRSYLDDITSLVHFEDTVNITEQHKINIYTKHVDNYSRQGQIFYNGRILHDGKTDLIIENRFITYDGSFFHNGKIFYDRSMIKVKSDNDLVPPFLYGSGGFREKFYITIDYGKFIEKHLAQLFYNGSAFHDGQVKYDGISDKSINEQFGPIKVNTKLSDTMPALENFNMAVGVPMTDTLPSSLRYDGRTFYDGSNLMNNGLAENHRMKLSLAELKDKAKGSLNYNGSINYDGTEQNSPQGNKPIYETMSMWIMKHRFYNSVYKYDGELKHDANILIPLE